MDARVRAADGVECGRSIARRLTRTDDGRWRRANGRDDDRTRRGVGVGVGVFFSFVVVVGGGGGGVFA